MKNWNDLQYGRIEDLENKLNVQSAGARFDSNSDTIIWNYGNTFLLKFKPEEITSHDEQQRSIRDDIEPQRPVWIDALFLFKFSIFSIYGTKEEAVYELDDIEIDDSGATISIPITDEISKMLRPGIYSYALVAYKPRGEEEDTADVRTLIGRKQGKIHVLS